jgi:hypothetical protein
MTLIRKGREPRPIVYTCTCGALNEFGIEAGETNTRFPCGWCGTEISFNLDGFYTEVEKQDDRSEQAWHERSQHELKKEKKKQ